MILFIGGIATLRRDPPAARIYSMTNRSPLPKAPRVSLVEATIGLIRSQIEGGAWKVGERIPKEQELAGMLQVSRNTVREAIRVLSHANVLEVRQGDGTYVRSDVDPAEVMRKVSRSSLRDHFEVQVMLETEAARLAACHRTEADLALLRRLLAERSELHNHRAHDDFAAADVAFHAAIALISGNAALAELYRYFSKGWRLNTVSTVSILLERDLAKPNLKAHEAIVDAIERQDGEAAAQAVRAVLAPVIAALAN
jgi:DNA-binding FadR family transcriptional regulator